MSSPRLIGRQATRWSGATGHTVAAGLAYDPWLHFFTTFQPQGWSLVEDQPAIFHGQDVMAVTDWKKRTVTLAYDLTAGEARCTLTHELVHIERGPAANNDRLAELEEREVERITAARLIVFDELLAAAPRVDGFEDLADLMNVDRTLILVALRLLTNHQHQQLLRFANLHGASTMEGRSGLRRRKPGRNEIMASACSEENADG